jgi:hypothetical protein
VWEDFRKGWEKFTDPNAWSRGWTKAKEGLPKGLIKFTQEQIGVENYQALTDGQWGLDDVSAVASVGGELLLSRIKVIKGAKKASNGANIIKNVCNCFVEGTKVLTDEGEKNIEDIQVGDKVLSKSEFDENGELAYKEVTALYTNYRNDIIKLYIGDLLIETTDNHPFWVEGRGWVFADELQVGDRLQKADGSTLTIDKVEFVLLDEPVMVYNFTVEEFHTYYVTDLGIWVHNTDCDLPNLIAAKSLGKGSTGRTTPNNLNEQLAMKQVLSDPLKGATELTKVTMTDKRWLAEDGWVKMSQNVNGIEIHFVYNKKTGQFDDFKFK